MNIGVTSASSAPADAPVARSASAAMIVILGRDSEGYYVAKSGELAETRRTGHRAVERVLEQNLGALVGELLVRGRVTIELAAAQPEGPS